MPQDIFLRISAALILLLLAAVGYYVREMALALKGLNTAFNDFRAHVAESYVSKDDCLTKRADCRLAWERREAIAHAGTEGT